MSIHEELKEPEVLNACRRIARFLLSIEQKVIGLWPTTPDVGILPLAVSIARALTELADATYAVVDANRRWPATVAPVTGDADHWGWQICWLDRTVALFTTSLQRPASADVFQLREMVAENRQLFSRMLVDLTGFECRGEHLEAISVLDGVLLVVHAGSCSERDLVMLREQLRKDKELGVVLLG